MITRRDALQIAAATAASVATGGFPRAMAQQRLTQDQLFDFDDFGNVTLLHFSDLHAQLAPVNYREPSQNLGAGEGRNVPPHISGAAFLKRFGIAPKSAAAYAMSSEDFSA